jgi:hypothetical protein
MTTHADPTGIGSSRRKVFAMNQNPDQPTGIFDGALKKAWPYRYQATIVVSELNGGIPRDPRVIESWLRARLADPTDADVHELLAKTKAELGLSEVTDEVITEAANLRGLAGFKSDPEHGLFIEGRQIKSAIKEAVSVCVAAGKLELKNWGKTKKNLSNFVAEHVQVPEDRIYLGRKEYDEVKQGLVHTWRGDAPKYNEVCYNVALNFSVWTDWDFDKDWWAMVWTTGQLLAVGANRSQQAGRYKVTKWEKE